MSIDKLIFAVKDLVDGWPNQGPVKRPEPAPSIESMKASATITNLNLYKNVPTKWRWLLTVQGLPNLLEYGLREYGVLEYAGTANNKRIIDWADEIAKFHSSTYNNWSADWYNKDSVPWCGLFAAVVCVRTGRKAVDKYLTALAWANWGKSVDWRNKLNNIWLGDIAVFTRSGGGHVGFVCGVTTDGKYVAVLGGNQSNAVNIKLFPISRIYAIRRPAYNIKPTGAIHKRISSSGLPISTYEG